MTKKRGRILIPILLILLIAAGIFASIESLNKITGLQVQEYGTISVSSNHNKDSVHISWDGGSLNDKTPTSNLQVPANINVTVIVKRTVTDDTGTYTEIVNLNSGESKSINVDFYSVCRIDEDCPSTTTISCSNNNLNTDTTINICSNGGTECSSGTTTTETTTCEFGCENKACLAKSNCTNECDTIGTNKCSLNNTGYETCGDYDSDTCLEWSSATPCNPGKSCSEGACSSKTTQTQLDSNPSDKTKTNNKFSAKNAKLPSKNKKTTLMDSKEKNLFRINSKKSKIISPEGIEAPSEIPLTEARDKIYAIKENKLIEIKIDPDTAIKSIKYLAEPKNIEEIKLTQEEENIIAYELTIEKSVKFLKLFNSNMTILAKINSKDGKIISIERPWWSFLTEEDFLHEQRFSPVERKSWRDILSINK